MRSMPELLTAAHRHRQAIFTLAVVHMILSLVVGGALFGIGGAILAAPVVAASRDLYRYGFHRFGGQPRDMALDLALHGAPPLPPEDETGPPPAPSAEPSPA
jgi:hypothetical protein